MSEAKILENNPILGEDLFHFLEKDFPWERLQNQTILITGASGFLGSFLSKVLLEVGRKYDLGLSLNLVLRNKSSSLERLQDYLEVKFLNIYYHDLSFPLHYDFPKADYFIHAASQASPKFYNSDPVGTIKANSLGTSFLLDKAVESKAKKFLFLSGGETYGVINDEVPSVDERQHGYLDPMEIRSCYAESKRLGENMCASWCHQYGLDTTVARLFHTFGPGMSFTDGRVFSDFVSDVVNNRNIKMKSNGKAIRSFCYLSEAIEGLLILMFSGKPGDAYNLANPANEVSITELAQTLCDIFPEKKLSIDKQDHHSNSYIKTKVIRTTPDISKIQNLGWNPSISIIEGFKRTIESYKA